MVVSVETNLVLELAFEQEERDAANAIVQAAENGEIELHLPAYALIEPLHTILNHDAERSAVTEALQKQAADLRRSAPDQATATAISDVALELGAVSDAQLDRLEAVQQRLIRCARQITPATAEILSRGRELERELALRPPDAIVAASVEADCRAFAAESILISRDKDMLTPRVQEHFRDISCRVIGSFTDGLAAARAAG